MNMKTKHSPIPWLARTYPNARGQITTIKIWSGSEWKGRMVCAIAAGGCTLDLKQDCANAHLIAAAPALYEACKAFYQAECEKFARDIMSRDAQPDSPVQKAWLLARAALAQSEGKEGA